MPNIEERILQADSLLAPYAVKHGNSLGRAYEEPGDATRFPFQRDRGRIVHTQSFRRLKGKTQVFVGGQNDHHRTRLTHTLEVSGVSRDIARTLRLNEDLAECIALAHDLGHPPFGHAGEAALNGWMQGHGASFEHNTQSHRILTILEEHSSHHKGLNVNYEILDGLLKHRTPFDAPQTKTRDRSPSLEAQVVDLADEIAYTAHDCEDGLRAALFTKDAVTDIPLAARARRLAEPRGTSLRGSLIHLLVQDLYMATEEQLVSQRITTLDAVYTAKNPLITFSVCMRKELDTLREFLWKNMYNHPHVLQHNETGKQTVLALCDALLLRPPRQVAILQKRTSGSPAEAVKDYVAGMTDAYAQTQLTLMTRTSADPHAHR